MNMKKFRPSSATRNALQRWWAAGTYPVGTTGRDYIREEFRRDRAFWGALALRTLNAMINRQLTDVGYLLLGLVGWIMWRVLHLSLGL